MFFLASQKLLPGICKVPDNSVIGGLGFIRAAGYCWNYRRQEETGSSPRHFLLFRRLSSHDRKRGRDSSFSAGFKTLASIVIALRIGSLKVSWLKGSWPTCGTLRGSERYYPDESQSRPFPSFYCWFLLPSTLPSGRIPLEQWNVFACSFCRSLDVE